MYQIVGKKRVDFKPKDAEKPVKGYTLYVVYPTEDFEGYVADKIYISDFIAEKHGYVPQVGDQVDIYYDRHGRITTFRKIENN